MQAFAIKFYFLALWSKAPPHPRGNSYLLCSLIKNPEEEDHPQSTWYKFFEEGPLPPGSWLGNIVNGNPPRGGEVSCDQLLRQLSHVSCPAGPTEIAETLCFYCVASSPGSPLPYILDGHRKLVGSSAIPTSSCPRPSWYPWGSIVGWEVPPDESSGLITLHPPKVLVFGLQLVWVLKKATILGSNYVYKGYIVVCLKVDCSLRMHQIEVDFRFR